MHWIGELEGPGTIVESYRVSSVTTERRNDGSATETSSVLGDAVT